MLHSLDKEENAMRKNLFGAMIAATIVLLAVLGAAPAHAASLAGAPAPAAAVVAPTPLSVPGATANAANAVTCPAAVTAPTAESALPDFMSPPAHRLGYCHCGCSSVRSCHTSADCGGASCDQVISCC
jgi:hypothetical protein